MVQETQKGAIVATQNDDSTIKTEMAFYFDIIQEHSLTLQNQITDNYIENNTAIQDHIAKSPLTISLRGLIGEVVYTPPTAFLKNIKNGIDSFTNSNLGFTVTDKLGPISAILPEVSNLNQIARNTVQYVEASYRRYEKIFDSIQDFIDGKGSKETRLQEVYRKLSVLRANDTLLTVITPYTESGYPFSNMAIQSITLRQGNENYVSDIELTLKQLNFANTYTTKPDESVMSKYNACARTKEANHGKAQGVNNDSFIGATIYKFTGKEPQRYNG